MQTNPYNDDKRLLELLERWESGDFSRSDEQELQALADSDAFRREAVEGFWALPEANHATHLASLRARLRERTGIGRRVVFTQIMAAAAVVLLILAAIVFFPSEQKEASMAAEQATQPILDTQPIASNFPEQKPPETARSAPPPPPQTEQMLSQTARPGQTFPTMAESGPDANSAASGVAASPAPDDDETTRDKAVASKPVEAESAYNKVLEVQDLPDSAPGNMAKRAETKKTSDEMAKAKQKAVPQKSQPASPDVSQPQGGWGAFQDYLRRNARLPEAARQNNVSGSVRLQFRLDANNQPIDFQTIRALGFGCEEEAIRLIRAYPWQRGSDQELTVDVPFVR